MKTAPSASSAHTTEKDVKTEPEFTVSVTTKKPSYSHNEPITLECVFENATSDEIVLQWDEPTYKLWISGGLSIHSSGWQSNLLLIPIKPNSTVTKEIRIGQNDHVPYLERGDHDVNVDFRLNDHDPSSVSVSLVIHLNDEPQTTLNLKSVIVSAAKTFLEAHPSETVIDYTSGYITDYLQPEFWTVSFDNRGPKLFGVTEINVEKKTGIASWPSHRTPTPISH